MRLALISDIHANAEALRVLADVLSDADKVLCLGDLVGYYCQVNEVIEEVRGLDSICLLGNHDRFLLDGCPDKEPPAVQFGIAFAERVITPEHRQWLSSLPLVWGGVLGGRSILMTHGSPWRPLTDYLYKDNPAIDQLSGFDYDVVGFAQTHRALKRTESRPFLLNPGSVGQSRDLKAHACAMLLDTDSMAVTTVERKFDPQPVIDLAVRHGAGNWINKHLR